MSTSSNSMDTDIRMHERDIYNDNLIFPSEAKQDLHPGSSIVTSPKRDAYYADREFEEKLLREFDKVSEPSWNDPPALNRFGGQPIRSPGFHAQPDIVDRALDDIRHEEMQIRREMELNRLNHQRRGRFPSPRRMLPTRGRGLHPMNSPYARPRPPHHFRPQMMQRPESPRFGPRGYYG